MGVNHVFLINNLRTVVLSLRWISVYFFILKEKNMDTKNLVSNETSNDLKGEKVRVIPI